MDEFLSKLWTAIKAVLSEAEQIALTFLSTAASSIAKSGGAVLVSAAEAAVKAAQTQGGTGEEKFNAAFTAVMGTLKDAGVDAAENAVNIAIEAAVAKMKADQAASADSAS